MSLITHDVETERYSTLGDMIETTAQRWPGNIALTVDNRTYSYTDLVERADLYRRGFSGNGKFCGLFGRRDFPIFAGLVAALRGGRTYVPIASDDPQVRQLDQMRQLKLDLIIVDRHDEVRLRSILSELLQPITVILADHDKRPEWCDTISHHRFLSRAELSVAEPVTERRDDNPDAYLLFTSGSTGVPKGVLVSHSNVLSYVGNFVALYGADEQDRFSQLAPLGFDFSVHDIFTPWRVGAAACVFEKGDAFQLARFFSEERISVCGTVPSTVVFLNRLHTLSDNQFPDLRVTVFCGEPLAENVARLWNRAAPQCRIDNIYGPTEATVAVTYFPWKPADNSEDRVVPIGWAFAGTRLRVADSNGAEVDDGEIGELWIAGEQVAKGYWGNPELTSKRFVHQDDDRWYRTGDLVRRTPRDGLIYIGRADNQFQVLGQRVDRLEVETLLRRVSQARDVAILPWPVNEHNIVEGLAYFLEGCSHDELSLRRMCRTAIPRAMWPSQIVLCELPKNRNGKTNYQELQAVLEARQSTSAGARSSAGTNVCEGAV